MQIPNTFLPWCRSRLSYSLVVLPMVMASMVGCGQDRALAPVAGKVMYKGRPLRFGAVVFQPEQGQPATGMIQPDGTFQLYTRGEGDGAAVGKNRVRITCYEGQNPAMKSRAAGRGEPMLGKPLIPKKYLYCDTSGITVEVRPGHNEPFLFELNNNTRNP